MKKIEYLFYDTEKCRLCEKLVNRINFIHHIGLCKKLTRHTIKAFALTDKLISNIQCFESNRRLLKFSILKILNEKKIGKNGLKPGVLGNYEFWDILHKSEHVSKNIKRSYKYIYKVHVYFKTFTNKLKADPIHLKYDSILRLQVKKTLKKIDNEMPEFTKLGTLLYSICELLSKRMKTLITRNKYVIDRSTPYMMAGTNPSIPNFSQRLFFKKHKSTFSETILELQNSSEYGITRDLNLENKTSVEVKNTGPLKLMKRISSDIKLREEFEHLVKINFNLFQRLDSNIKNKLSKEESDSDISIEEDFYSFSFEKNTSLDPSTIAVMDSNSHVTVSHNDTHYVLRKLTNEEKRKSLVNPHKYVTIQRGNSASADDDGPTGLFKSTDILNLEKKIGDSFNIKEEGELIEENKYERKSTSTIKNVMSEQILMQPNKEKKSPVIYKLPSIEAELDTIETPEGSKEKYKEKIRKSFKEIMGGKKIPNEIHNNLILIGKGLYKIVKREFNKKHSSDEIVNKEKKKSLKIQEDITEESESREHDPSDNSSSSSSSDLIDEDFLPELNSLNFPEIELAKKEETPKEKTFRRMSSFSPMNSNFKFTNNERIIERKKSLWLSKVQKSKPKISTVTTFTKILREKRKTSFSTRGDPINFDYLEDSERIIQSDPEDYASLRDKYLDIIRAEMKDFIFIKKLGEGSFGKVFLVKQKKTGDYYAMKIIPAKKSMKVNELKNIVNERDVFSLVQNEFCVNALCTFVYKTLVCFVIEYMPGGDLFNHAFQGNFKLQSSNISVYIAQLVLGIEGLHNAGIIHRDIKPENILVGPQGNLKLTDYGLSDLKNKMSKTEGFRIKGSLNFMAPEIFDFHRKEIGFEIDWYALGVLIFDLIKERLPFVGQTMEELIEKIKEHKIIWNEPGEEDEVFQFTPELKSLVEGLLEKDPSQRLGRRGAKEIKEHAFFNGKYKIDWEKVQEKKYFVYRPQNLFDVQKFEQRNKNKNEINMEDFVEKEFKEDLYEFHQAKEKFECLAKSKFDMFKVETLITRNKEVAHQLK